MNVCQAVAQLLGNLDDMEADIMVKKFAGVYPFAMSDNEVEQLPSCALNEETVSRYVSVRIVKKKFI